jgi:hypothetical protein
MPCDQAADHPRCNPFSIFDPWRSNRAENLMYPTARRILHRFPASAYGTAQDLCRTSQENAQHGFYVHRSQAWLAAYIYIERDWIFQTNARNSSRHRCPSMPWNHRRRLCSLSRTTLSTAWQVVEHEAALKRTSSSSYTMMLLPLGIMDPKERIKNRFGSLVSGASILHGCSLIRNIF